MTEVSAGIIRRRDGRILICRRGEGRRNAHLWEFPGGKREAGESAAACLARELREELALQVHNIREYDAAQAQGIAFTFLTADTAGEPVLTEHEDARFVRPCELTDYEFCPADVAVAQRLAQEKPRVRHFFWDFDGTVMDTYPVMLDVLEKVLAARGLPMDRAHALAMMKDNLRYCLTATSAENGLPEETIPEEFHREELKLRWEGARAMPDMAWALRELRARGGYHYLVTHRNRQALSMLTIAGLDGLFDGYVTSDDGFPRKPAPDGLLHLLERFGLDTAECMMIGDRPLDTDAGRNAGILSCMYDPDGRFPDAPCTLYVRSAWELVERL